MESPSSLALFEVSDSVQIDCKQPFTTLCSSTEQLSETPNKTTLLPPLWRRIMRGNFTDWKALADYLELSHEQRGSILTQSHFPLNIPQRLAAKAAKGTLNDPILKQFLPTIAEKEASIGFCSDPVGDALAQKSGKLLHKYRGRMLILCSNSCAMHCRYCFRQNFAYDRDNKGFDKELRIIASDSSISEVILSGGDPLSLSDNVLGALLRNLSRIAHLKRIRFHTRFPIGIPERIDDSFVSLIAAIRQQVVCVIHVNHPKELDEEIFYSLRRLQQANALLLSQSVLLHNVNDDEETLIELCEMLINHGIVPYYLFQLDKVEGAAHFEVDEKKGQRLVAAIAARLPGYGVPKYVREIAGEPNKSAIL